METWQKRLWLGVFRQRSYWLFLVSLAVSLALLLSLGIFAYLMQQGLQQASRNLLAGDRVIAGADAPQPEWLRAAQQHHLQLAQSMTFPSMLLHGESMQLASVRAVTDTYPLYGQMTFHPAGQVVPGQIWLSPALLKLLAVQIGSPVQFGSIHLTVAGTIEQEPDQELNPFALAPRAIIAWSDAKKAGVLLPGSRVEYRTFLRGQSQQLSQFAQWLLPKLPVGQRWLEPTQNNNRFQKIFSQSSQFFLTMGGMACVLSLIALALSLLKVCQQLRMPVLLLRTLGAGQRQIRDWIVRLVVMSLVLGGCGALVLGGLFLSAITQVLSRFLPSVSFSSVWQTIPGSVWIMLVASSFALLLGMIAEPVVQLLSLPVARLHQQLQLRYHWFPAACALVVLIVSLVWRSTGVGHTNSVLVVSAFIVVTGVMSLFTWGLLRVLPTGRPDSGYALALNYCRQHPGWVFRQSSLMGLVLVMLGIGGLLRQDLQQQLLPYLDTSAPNRFLLNISTREKTEIEQWFQQNQIVHAPLYPVVRGRLVAINQIPVRDESLDETGADQAQNDPSSARTTGRIEKTVRPREGIGRELTLTAVAELPDGNQVVSGQNWQPNLQAQVSVEQNTAEKLGLALGDQLTFRIGGQDLSVTIRNFRRVNWQSLQPNFIMIFSPDVFANQRVNWMTSFRMSSNQLSLEVAFIKNHPTVTLINIEQILVQVQRLLQQVSNGLMVLLSLLGSGVTLVLVVQWQAILQERQAEFVLMRILGASRKQLFRMQWWQGCLVGGLTGLVAAMACELAKIVLVLRISEQIVFSWWLWVSLPLVGIAIVMLMSWLFFMPLLRRTLTQQMYPGK